jgi:hydroxymethylpyrimidine/phosphomethylpyrimidine kinase
MTKSISRLTPPRVLTIAGSDSGGSAGVQADLKTYTARGVFGLSAVTVVTAQNTRGVVQAHPLPVEFVAAQIKAVLDDIAVSVVKTGLLLSADIIRLVADTVPDVPLIVDPVLVNGKGEQIVSDAAIEAYKSALIPRASIITPNMDEAQLLAGLDNLSVKQDFYVAAQRLQTLGVGHVLVKGGHLETQEITDVLYDGDQFFEWRKPALPVDNPHGVGCTFASAIAAEIAKGSAMPQAVETAHEYLYRALQGAQKWHLGGGRPPVNHFVDL